MEPMSRRERERQEHRRHILRVAEGLFAGRGFVRVSMKEIAGRAEFALGTLYKFFKGKRALYGQVLERKVKELSSLVSGEMARETSPVQVVERFITAKLRFLLGNPDFAALYFAELHTLPPAGGRVTPPAVREAHRLLLQRLTRAFEQGIAEGVFADVPAAAMATALDGQTSAFVASRLGHGPCDVSEEEVDTAKRMFLRGALAEPERRPPGPDRHR